ncbi:DMT family transporter [Puerhibacterium puerhi]|uniref:DMT family transporter n=1 Tax=Puerhibacterium puerhi TaxID=2692623 RepID=UPI001358294A|nr:DMT family transporter [Puerhibacterium puerhi]
MRTPIGIPRGPAGWATAALAALFVVCWSSGFVGAKLGAGDAPVTTVLMWRFVPLALLLLPALVVRGRGAGRAGAGGRALARDVVIGVLSQTGYLLSVYGAIELGVSTGTTALVDGIQPLAVAALAGPLLGVAVTGRQWAGLAVGLVGVAAVTWADATAPAGGAPWWGYVVPFAGMLSLVAATFLERRAPSATPPLRALAVHCATSAAVFAGLALATGTAAPPRAASFWVAVAWLVVLSTFGGYGLCWVLLRRVGVTTVDGLMFLVPAVTTAWGAAMFAEPVTALTVVGLALALGACALVARDDTVRDGGVRGDGVRGDRPGRDRDGLSRRRAAARRPRAALGRRGPRAARR